MSQVHTKMSQVHTKMSLAFDNRHKIRPSFLQDIQGLAVDGVHTKMSLMLNIGFLGLFFCR